MSSDKKYYDDESAGSLAAHAEWMKEIEYYFTAYAKELDGALEGRRGELAELGAGSCGLSLCVSRLSNVSVVYAADISVSRMEKLFDMSMATLWGDASKVKRIECDFNKKLPFATSSLDAILFDASLHHSRSMWNLLAECGRVLKHEGLLIAQREGYLSALRARSQLKQLLKTPEVMAQVSENRYMREQYNYYLKVNGFDVKFIARTPSRVKSALSFLNGTIFTDGILWCKKCKPAI